MPATREQLLARWETSDGQQLAELVRQALDPILLRRRSSGQREIRPLELPLLQRLADLSFADEVSLQVDLRGLHVQDETLAIKYTDLSNARMDYTYEIDRILYCQMVGTVLDGSSSIKGMFREVTLHGASLIGVSFNGATFRATDVSRTNFRGAHLVLADLSRANCAEASFVGADLRFVEAPHADFSGADLREADLTEANLGDIKFDSQTRLQGANLRGALLSPDFRTFAQQAGAQLSERQTFVAKHQVELQATIKALQENNVDGHLDEAIALMSTERDQAPDPLDPDYVVQQALDERFDRAGSPPWVEEVWETWSEISKGLAYYV